MAIKIGSLVIKLAAEHGLLTQGMTKAEHQVSKSQQRMQADLDRMKAGFAKLGLAVASAASAAAGALAVMVRQSINTADEISKAAQRIGIGTEELSRLRYAADLSGLSFEQLEKSVLVLNRNMAGIGGESKKATAAFDQLGVSTRNADGTLRSSTQVLKDLSDRFAQMPDGAEKSALAMAVLGKSGADMIPLLNGGSEALAQLTGEADKFGIVIDAETGRKAEAFNDNLTRLKGVSGALATQVAAELLPMLVDLTDGLVRNSDKVRSLATDVGDFARGVEILGGYVTMVTDAFNSRFSPAIEWARRELGALYDIATGLLNPLGTAITLVTRLGRESVAADRALVKLGGGSSWRETWFQGLNLGAKEAATVLPRVGGAVRSTSQALRDMKRQTEESARAFESLYDRLFPYQAASRKFAEEMALIQRSRLDDAEKEEMISRLERESFRNRTSGLGKATVSEGVLDTEPLVNFRDEFKRLQEEFAAGAKKTQIQTVRIAESVRDMAERISSSLRGLVEGIRSGDFFDIFDGVLRIVTTLGSAGLFGSAFQNILNRPVPGNANGTAYHPGGLMKVGERGPEILQVPRGGRVIPNHELREAGSMGITITMDESTGRLGAFVRNAAGQIVAEAAPSIARLGSNMALGEMNRAQARSLA